MSDNRASRRSSSSQQDTAYVYQPLAFEDSIRLVELLPLSHRSDELQCRLRHARLSERPSFEALSYTWGQRDFPARLTDVDSRGCFRITANLHAALKQFRHPNSVRTLWIDYLCINQGDVLERNQQVRHMTEIYRSAVEVLVWLGDFDATAAIAEIDRVLVADHEQRVDEDFLRKINSTALNTVFTRDWFKRIWTIQEHACAQRVSFHCGSQVLTDAQLYRITYILFKLQRGGTSSARGVTSLVSLEGLGLDHFALDNAELMWLVRNNMVGRPFHLLQICNKLRRSSCTDDRDRVYGVLGIHSDSEIQIQPNYEKSVPEVYRELAAAYIKMGKIEILNLCYTMPFFMRNLSMPSWTPDWRSTLNPPLLAEFDVNAFSAGSARRPGIRLLEDSNLDPNHQAAFRRERDLRYAEMRRVALEEGLRDPELTLTEGDRYLGSARTDTKASLRNEKLTISPSETSICVARGFLIDFIQVVENGKKEMFESFSASTTSAKYERTLERNLVFERTFEQNIRSECYVNGESASSAFARTIFADNATSTTIDHFFKTEKAETANVLGDVWGTTKMTLFGPDDTQYWHVEFLKLMQRAGLNVKSDPSEQPIPELVPVPSPRRECQLLFLRALHHIGLGRSFFITEKGWVGLCPFGTEPGHAICILHGGRTPFVLQAAQGEGCLPAWYVVGECYVHGLMYGEMEQMLEADPGCFQESEFILW